MFRRTLLQTQAQWHQKFDFVLEIFTIQALPPKYEEEVIGSIAEFASPEGQLLVIAEVSAEKRSFENGPPWVLTTDHIDAFAALGYSVEGHYVESGSSRRESSDTHVTLFRRGEGPTVP